MAYVQLRTITGESVEKQVIDIEQDILISEGYSKFKSYGDMIEKVRDELTKERASWEVEDEIVNDYFDGRSFEDIYWDKGYSENDLAKLIKNISRKYTNKANIQNYKKEELKNLYISCKNLIEVLDNDHIKD